MSHKIEQTITYLKSRAPIAEHHLLDACKKLEGLPTAQQNIAHFLQELFGCMTARSQTGDLEQDFIILSTQLEPLLERAIEDPSFDAFDEFVALGCMSRYSPTVASFFEDNFYLSVI